MVNFGDLLIYVTSLFGIYTSIFFIITINDNRKKMKKRKALRTYPKVCIIVPCFNEEKTVAKTIKSLLRLDYPKNKLEIIVVDDGSTDNTFKVASEFKEKGVKVYRKENGGKYTALNYALDKTDAEIVGALDADSFVHPKALKRMLPYFEEEEVVSVTPSMKIYKPRNWLQTIQMMEYLIGIFLRKVFAFLGSIHVTPGPFTLYKKEFFEKHGKYREAYLTEDIEIALRIQSLNYHIENAPDAYVYTIGPDTFKGLYKQRIRWYYGFTQNVLDYKKLFSAKHGNLGLFILPASFFSVFLVITTLFYTIYKFLEDLWKRYVFFKAINFDLKGILEFRFDPFFINTNSTMMLSLLALGISIGLLLLAKRVANEKKSIKYSYLVYVLCYWFLFGFWWLMAFYHKLAGKKTQWGHKSLKK